MDDIMDRLYLDNTSRDFYLGILGKRSEVHDAVWYVVRGRFPPLIFPPPTGLCRFLIIVI